MEKNAFFPPKQEKSKSWCHRPFIFWYDNNSGFRYLLFAGRCQYTGPVNGKLGHSLQQDVDKSGACNNGHSEECLIDFIWDLISGYFFMFANISLLKARRQHLDGSNSEYNVYVKTMASLQALLLFCVAKLWFWYFLNKNHIVVLNMEHLAKTPKVESWKTAGRQTQILQ